MHMRVSIKIPRIVRFGKVLLLHLLCSGNDTNPAYVYGVFLC